jgi:hypothetical protein
MKTEINIKKLLREGLLTELATGKHLIVVDVQPEYQGGFGRMASELFYYINQNYDSFTNVTFLYNGEETLGMISEHDYRDWLVEMGLDEEIAYDVRLYDKGYAFFRYCMDSDIEHQATINLVTYMYKHGVHDSRELDNHFWDGFINEYGDEDVRELLEFSDDAVHMPDLMDFLSRFNNIVLVGGHTEECLKEVEIALEALGKSYQTWHEYTY